MNAYKLVAIDTSKAVFTLHCIPEADRPVLRLNLTRPRLIPFFKKLAPTEIAMEACGGSFHWARALESLGHRLRLIPPQYVKPFVKRGKNDRNDAEAISEAAGRPNVHPVPIKSAERQAQLIVLKVRNTFIEQRTQLVNTLRGHAAEFGVIAAKGLSAIEGLLMAIEQETSVPPVAQAMLALLGQEIAHLDARLKEIDVQLLAAHKAHPLSLLLAGIPGIGPITALTFALEIDATAFASGRHLASWLGLTPKEQSTGGKQRMGGISHAGNERLRRLLVLGATSIVRVAVRPGNQTGSAWLRSLLARKPRKLAAVALANKMARIVWAMMTTGEAYRRAPAAA
jgi:transposase